MVSEEMYAGILFTLFFRFQSAVLLAGNRGLVLMRRQEPAA